MYSTNALREKQIGDAVIKAFNLALANPAATPQDVTVELGDTRHRAIVSIDSTEKVDVRTSVFQIIIVGHGTGGGTIRQPIGEPIVMPSINYMISYDMPYVMTIRTAFCETDGRVSYVRAPYRLFGSVEPLPEGAYPTTLEVIVNQALNSIATASSAEAALMHEICYNVQTPIDLPSYAQNGIDAKGRYLSIDQSRAIIEAISRLTPPPAMPQKVATIRPEFVEYCDSVMKIIVDKTMSLDALIDEKPLSFYGRGMRVAAAAGDGAYELRFQRCHVDTVASWAEAVKWVCRDFVSDASRVLNPTTLADYIENDGQVSSILRGFTDNAPKAADLLKDGVGLDEGSGCSLLLLPRVYVGEDSVEPCDPEDADVYGLYVRRRVFGENIAPEAGNELVWLADFPPPVGQFYAAQFN